MRASKIASAFVTVDPDTEGFKEKLEAAVQEAVDGISAQVRIGADDEDLKAKLDEDKARVDELDETTGTATLAADDEDLTAKTDDAVAKVKEVDDARGEATLAADDEDLTAKTDDAVAKVKEVDDAKGTATIDADTDPAKLAIADLQSEIAILKLNKAGFTIDADASPAEIKIAELEAELTALQAKGGNVSIGSSGSGGGGEGGGLLGALSVGLPMLMPGMAGAATGLGMLGGMGALAFGGIAKALSAAHQASQNVGQTSAQLAATEFSNSVQIQQAQQSIAQAHAQAAQTAVTSAAQIEQSQMSLASVVRNAAQSQIQAEQAVGQAQQGLVEANFGLASAQYNLTNAWIQAKYQLEQLRDAEANQATTLAAAQLAVQQAQYQQLLTDQNALSTSLDRQQAAIAVTQAQEQLTAVQQQGAETQAEYNLQNKAGVAGSQTVVQAQEAVKTALYGVKDAQLQLADAQRNVTVTELNNAEQVKSAQMAVVQAQEQAAFQQSQSAIAVQQAELNLTNTVREQKLQWASTMSTSNQAANQFVKDMSRLSAPARGVVNEILSMRGAFRRLETAAQATIAPGVVTFLKGIKDLMPEITGGVQMMGTATSVAFAQFGKQMQTPAFAHVFDGLIKNGYQFMDTVLPAFTQFIQELAKIGSANGASSGLANLLAGIAHGLTGLAASLAPYTKQINSFLSAVGTIIAAIGPPLGQIIGLVASALGPLSRYLDSHPNGTVVKVIGDIVGGMLAFKGLEKFVFGPFGKLFTGIKDGFETIKGIPGKISGAWDLLSGIPGKVGSAFSRAASGIARFGSGAITAIGNLSSRVWSAMTTAGSAVASFVAGFGTKLAEATTATVAWIAEHTIATATFIAENVAQAASATAAFIVENAATLGIAAAIAGLVAVAVYVGTHWKQVWGDIKHWAQDAWKFLTDGWGKYLFPELDLIKGTVEFVAQHWQQAWSDIKHWAQDAWNFIWNGFGKFLLPLLGPVGLIALGAIELYQHWNTIWDEIKSVAETVWSGILSGARGFVSGFNTVWSTLKTVFGAPVHFLVNTVYDQGIEPFWNKVVNAIGLGSLALKPITVPFAGGGVLPGYHPGHDTVPAMLSPGEGVLTPQAVRAIGPQTVHGLNAAFPAHSAASHVDHHKSLLGKEIARTGRREGFKHGAEHPALHALGFATGGVVSDITGGVGSILGSIGHGISGAFHDVTSFAGGVIDVGKMIAAVATGNTAAFVNAASASIGTKAAGDLGKIMIGIPKALVTDLAKELTSSVASLAGSGKLPGGGTGAVGSLPANWQTIAEFLSTHGFTKYAAAGVAGNILAESGGDPEILEIGGGGGGGLIQWTPYPAGYITGNYQQDLMTQLYAILHWGGGPGIVNRATSPSNAALIYQDYYERPASLTASLAVREEGANAVYQSMGWGKFDNGGVLMPGVGPVNTTGQPEAILDPQQTQLFRQFVQQMVASGGSSRPIQVTQQYIGSQLPTPEQEAQMMRSLALALSGP